jgi:hypothetical protein
MIRKTRSTNSAHSRNMPVEAPSQEEIKRLTSEIRGTWSPRTRAGRAAGIPTHVEIMVVPALTFGNSSGAI